jgi:hypothetical protein
MLQMASKNLEQSVMMRSDDPLAAYYYARVLKQVGRTKEDLDRAQAQLQKAISLDTRLEIPEVQLHRALMLMDNKDGNTNSEAVTALKNYITAYEHQRVTTITNQLYVPPNLDVLYGYLRLLGDKTWTAPNVSELQKAGTAGTTQTPSIVPASQQLSPNEQRNDRP